MRTRPRIRALVVTGAILALLVPVAAWAAARDFSDVPPSDRDYRAIVAVADAGLMTGNNGRFRPDQAVPRRGLAATLHRGLVRVGIDDTVEDIPTAQPDPPLIAVANMGIDGFQRGAQGVLVELDMQLETAQPLSDDCSVDLIATSTPQNFDVGTWTVNLYEGTRGQTVHATFIDGQLAGTLYSYEITADSSCDQVLTVVQGALTTQSAAFQANGQPFPEG